MKVYAHRYKVYTGPTITYHVADRLAKLGTKSAARRVLVTLIGTEHVYIKTDLTAEQLLRLLPSWKPSDIQELQ